MKSVEDGASLNIITEELNRAVDQLLGRASGPLHLRLLIQPIVAVVLAIRAGRKDAREGNPPYLWTVLTNSHDRQRLLQSGWMDVSKVLVIAFLIDTAYQIIIFRTFYPLQAVIVAVVLVVLPYALLRGLVTRLTRAAHHKEG